MWSLRTTRCCSQIFARITDCCPPMSIWLSMKAISWRKWPASIWVSSKGSTASSIWPIAWQGQPQRPAAAAAPADSRRERRGYAKWTEQLDEIVPRFGSLKDSWEKVFEMLQALAVASSGGQTEKGQSVLRLKPGNLPKEWEPIQNEESIYFKEMNRTVKVLDKMLTDMKDKLDDTVLQGMLTDLAGAVKDAGRIRDELRVFVRADKPEMVYWIESNPSARAKSIQLYTVPGDVSGQIREFFFDNKKSVVITSATLTVQKSFQYAAEQLGLNLRTSAVTVPFSCRRPSITAPRRW